MVILTRGESVARVQPPGAGPGLGPPPSSILLQIFTLLVVPTGKGYHPPEIIVSMKLACIH